MIPEISKDKIRKRIHTRIRQRMAGSKDRPRLNVYRSLNHIYAQLIDDSEGVTIAAASTQHGKKGAKRAGGNVASAKDIGKQIGQKELKKGTRKLVLAGAGIFTTDALKRWPMRPAKQAWSSNGNSDK